jgi:hypothetical protein
MLDYFEKINLSKGDDVVKLRIRGPLLLGYIKPKIELDNELEFKIGYVYDYEKA